MFPLISRTVASDGQNAAGEGNLAGPHSSDFHRIFSSVVPLLLRTSASKRRPTAAERGKDRECGKPQQSEANLAGQNLSEFHRIFFFCVSVDSPDICKWRPTATKRGKPRGPEFERVSSLAISAEEDGHAPNFAGKHFADGIP